MSNTNVPKVIIGLYQNHVSDLSKTIEFIGENGCDIVAAPICHPNFWRQFKNERNDTIADRHMAFSRSDLLLESTEWMYKFVARITDNIDCDSDDVAVRKHSEQTLLQELSISDHLVQHGFVMIRLKGTNTMNFARILSKNIKGSVLVEIPMQNPRKLTRLHEFQSTNTDDVNVITEDMSFERANECHTTRVADDDDDDKMYENPWTWWNKFRLQTDFNNKIMVALELPADLPSKEVIKRWACEPVSCLIVPSDIFMRNAQNYPVLSRAHQSVISLFIKNDVSFMIKCNRNDNSLRNYADYLRHLAHMHTALKEPMHGFDDVLEIPLQPLYDNLDAYTYEVFEKDPVKYALYQKAIELALIDKVPEAEIATRTVIVMVVGAGRGPIVRSTINASKNTKRKCKIFIVEKNPGAILTLNALKNNLWSDEDITLINRDMREFTPTDKVDILISELLGSFGDNELSPECLDGAQKHLKPDGISIPSKSTSYIEPIMSPRLYDLVRQPEKPHTQRDKVKSYATNAESSYVVYFKRVYHISDPQSLFEFSHPNHAKTIDNSRYEKRKFSVSLDCLLTGFAGYFDTILYKNISLSIHPFTHTKGLSSWFSIFFPITEPMQLKAGDEIELHFWRCISSHKVWYEWCVTKPFVTHIHNHNGQHCPIYK